MRYFRYAAPVVALAAFAFPVALNAAGAPAQHVRGTISAVTPKLVTVTTATGSVSVPLDAKTKVAGVVPATASEITSGTFIGTANVPGPGAARALEVVVFPKALAGTGEGDYPWDLPARGRSSSTMTNGTVASGGSRTSMMTNATVKNVTNGSVKTVTLTYKGGTKTVAIPASAPIVRVVPGSSALLKTGAHVVVFPGQGNAAAPFVIVGEQGVVPPM